MKIPAEQLASLALNHNGKGVNTSHKSRALYSILVFKSIRGLRKVIRSSNR